MPKLFFSRRRSLLLTTLLLQGPVFAESPKSELTSGTNLSQKNEIKYPLIVDYQFEPWNKDPKERDTGVLILRERQSNRSVKALLTEDAPNSSRFIGRFFISWQNDQSVQLDVFVPPQTTAKRDGEENLEKLMNEGNLPKKPYFLRRTNNQQKLTIYNSNQQAVAAFESFKRGFPSSAPVPSNLYIDQAALESARRTEVIEEQNRQAEQARKQELDRKKQEEEARLAYEKMKKEQEQLAEAERRQRIEKATKLADEALRLYQAQKFTEAENKFRQSIELNPTETSYYFQYGVSLYKNQKYNEALVAFKVVKNPKVNPREKAFYEGICHMKLKEFPMALARFDEVNREEDKVIAPSAHFFSGVIQFSQEQYPLAKRSFEKVLDISSDPQLDEQAENYIEQIVSIEQYQEKMVNPFTFNVTTGLMYDSNILLISNSSSSSATDKAGFRGLISANLDYRLIYQESHEWTAQLTHTDLYSVDNSFKANATLQLADPMVSGLRLPYKWKSKAFGKGYLLTLAPGYETLFLNTDGTGSREYTMGTALLSTEQTFVVSETYFTTLRIDLRQEASKIEYAGTADATKILLGNNNMWFMDAKKSEAALFNWTLLTNQSPDDNNAFNRVELASGYLMPVFKKSSWMNLFTAAQAIYPRSTVDRKDTNMNLNSSLSTPLAENFQGIFGVSYETNSSTVKANTYDKYTVMATVNWNTNF